MAEHPLAAKAVLVAQDECHAADGLRRLARHGGQGIDPAPVLEQAMRRAETAGQDACQGTRTAAMAAPTSAIATAVPIQTP